MSDTVTFWFSRYDGHPFDAALGGMTQTVVELIAEILHLEADWEPDRDHHDLFVKVPLSRIEDFTFRLQKAGIIPALCGVVDVHDEDAQKKIESLGYEACFIEEE